MSRQPIGVRDVCVAFFDRVGEGKSAAHCNGLTMADRILGGLCFKGMAKCMAQIEQGTPSGLALILFNDPGLERDSIGDRLGQSRAVERRFPGLRQPFEHVGISDQGGLEDFGVTRAYFPVGQALEKKRIGDHQARLVEGADEILAVPRVDPRLAAHRTVYLGQQSGGDLDEACAALGDRGSKASQIAHDAATEGDNVLAPLDIAIEQGFDDGLQATEALRRFAGLHNDGLTFDARAIQPGLDPVEMEVGDIVVRDHNSPLAGEERSQTVRARFQCARADNDVIGPISQAHRNSDAIGHSRPSKRSSSERMALTVI